MKIDIIKKSETAFNEWEFSIEGITSEEQTDYLVRFLVGERIGPGQIEMVRVFPEKI